MSSVCDIIKEQSSAADAAALLVQTVRKLEDQWPDLSRLVSDGLGAQAEDEQDAACERCVQLLSGISSLPGFQAPYPPRTVYELRQRMDHIVRSAFPDQRTVQQMGFEIGNIRWAAAAEEAAPARRSRGQPSQVNLAENIAKVKDVLQQYSQVSSTPCKNSDGDWVLTNTLTKRRSTI